jgi:hypothetical protein
MLLHDLVAVANRNSKHGYQNLMRRIEKRLEVSFVTTFNEIKSD